MAKRNVGMVKYAVVETNKNGVVRFDLSHWLFENYMDALKFKDEMNEANKDDEDYVFIVISLLEHLGD